MADESKGSLILDIIQRFSINPEDARALVDNYAACAAAKYPNATAEDIKNRVVKKIIARYSSLAATSGGVTALVGVIPGLGALVAAAGGGFADAGICAKLQVDMTMCIAAAYGWDLTTEDAKHASMVIALGGAVEKFGSQESIKFASQAGVRLVKQYLSGSTLVVLKQIASKFGVAITQKGFVKAIPFGVGFAISSSSNYLLTRYVGNSSSKWFTIEFDTRGEEAVA